MELTVLLTSAGRRVALGQAFRESARELGITLRLLACDMAPHLSAACASADLSFCAPPCASADYGPWVLALCEREGVDLVVPTNDNELAALAAIAAAAARGGTRVHVSTPAVIDVVRDKERTADHLAAAGLPTPRTVALEKVRDGTAAFNWPLFVKPRAGSASRSLSVAHSVAELPRAVSEPMVAQSLLKGPEYTVNVFVDLDGVMRAAVPHQRIAVRAGEVEKGLTVRNSLLDELAAAVVAALPDLRGVFCFQVIHDVRAGPQIIEINARFGGGYPLAHAAGATFTRWLLEEVGSLPRTAADDWKAGVLMLRYDAAIILPNP